MYGPVKFLYQNVIEAAHVSVTNQRPGVVTGTMNDGLGTIEMQAFGEYVGTSIKIYSVQIYDVSAGTGVGQALFRWRDNTMADGVWNDGYTTSEAAQTLNDAAQINFPDNGGVFNQGDIYTFRALPSFSIANALSWDRGSFYISESLDSPNKIQFQFSASTLLPAFVLGDHNLTASATVTLKAGVDATVDRHSLSLTPSLESMGVYPGVQYAYWELQIDDATNPDGYLRIGRLYGGNFLQLSKNAEWDSDQDLTEFAQDETSEYGIGYSTIHAHQDRFTLDYSGLPNADWDALRVMKKSIHNPLTGIMQPLYLHLFSDEQGYMFLMHWKGGLPREFVSKNKNTLSLKFEEVVKPYYV